MQMSVNKSLILVLLFMLGLYSSILQQIRPRFAIYKYGACIKVL